jgi:hypothetical protein
MPSKTRAALEGPFQSLIHAPDGQPEGALVHIDGAPAQLVLARGDAVGAAQLAALSPGQALRFDATRQGPSDKGPAEHPVYQLDKLRAVDGQAPRRFQFRPRPAPYTGRVVRFNYARHGARNGVVLDSGDFIHLKPDGMAGMALAIGDEVAADGDAWPLATGRGYVVEATSVNGRAVRRKPPRA